MLRPSPIETSEPVWELADLFPHQGAWTEAGVYETGAAARSALLDGFEVVVADVWKAAHD